MPIKSSDFTDTVECYSALKLDSISSEWTERVLEGNFCIEVDNSALQSSDSTDALQHLKYWSDVVDCTRKWININSMP